jgi:hypothetical protein
VKVTFVERFRHAKILMVFVALVLAWIAKQFVSGDFMGFSPLMQGLGAVSLTVILAILSTKVFAPAKIHISRECIEFEPGSAWGFSPLPSWSVLAASAPEIQMKCLQTGEGILDIFADFQRKPHRYLSILAYCEQGRADWFTAEVRKSDIRNVLEKSPVYQALISMGYRVTVVPPRN